MSSASELRSVRRIPKLALSSRTTQESDVASPQGSFFLSVSLKPRPQFFKKKELKSYKKKEEKKGKRKKKKKPNLGNMKGSTPPN